MMPLDMSVTEVGNIYELKRDQWEGNIARISRDPKLLEEVKKYRWTYCKGRHPYLRSSKLGMSLHEFVLGFVYGAENIDKMQAEGNIIEHLDNDGLNCTYENLHILSDDMNKTKAFSIDKKNKSSKEEPFPAYIMDVYYLHEKKQFQMQIFMNETLFNNKYTGNPIEEIFCIYDSFDNLFLDWLYLLNEKAKRVFDMSKFHVSRIFFKERPIIPDVTPEEMNSPTCERNGELYASLDAKKDGVPMFRVIHTALRRIDM